MKRETYTVKNGVVFKGGDMSMPVELLLQDIEAFQNRIEALEGSRGEKHKEITTLKNHIEVLEGKPTGEAPCKNFCEHRAFIQSNKALKKDNEQLINRIRQLQNMALANGSKVDFSVSSD